MANQDVVSSELYAAVDLGSNSFHFLLARWENGALRVMDKRKEMVRLAAGLDQDRRLSQSKQAEALAALARIAPLLKGVPSSNKRAVGTNTLRAAKQSEEFLAKASQTLGFPIDVIAGKEEARLIYVGVSHCVQPVQGNQLVVDIGGGSTESIIGKQFEPLLSHSLRMGCVSYTQGFFPGGAIKEDRMNAAMFAASNELSTLQQQFLEAGFETAIGSSGTIAAVRQTAIDEGWSRGTITLEVLRKLRHHLFKAGHVDRILLKSISEQRREVLPGGVAILSAIFERLHIEEMSYSEAALRDGVLYELIGRSSLDDIRDRTVASMQARYGVATDQAERVWRRLASFLEQAGSSLELDGEQWRRLARWAAALHEVGLAINYPGHHKHGAYILEHSDMPGFSRSEQQLLAGLVLCHRRKFRFEVLSTIPGVPSKPLVRLAVLLRLAVHVERQRTDAVAEQVTLSANGRQIRVALGSGEGSDNGEDYSLLAAELVAEAEQLSRAKFELEVTCT